MVKLEKFDVVFSNPEHAYFAGQEISGKIIIETSEPKKVNELLLELKGRARTYWTKHSGKSTKHCSHSEPYFCQQFNTHYTHRFTNASPDGKTKERILPAGVHEVPFSYTLPKTLPTSFEGDFGYVRYTCKAICERPWDFDIISRRAFTVVGIEDINEDPEALQPATASDSNHNVRVCCRKRGSIIAELTLNRTGFTPGEIITLNGRINNHSEKSIKNSSLLIRQLVIYRAKTFAGAEYTKSVNKTVIKVEKGEINARSESIWKDEKIILPSLPPKLSKCSIIDVKYIIELEADSIVSAPLPFTIGTIPSLSDLISKTKKYTKNGNISAQNGPVEQNDQESVVQVTITDEAGNPVESANDELSAEMESLLSAKKRVRMPSSILSELYPSLPSPYYKESHFGQVDISEDKESIQYGESKFAPKYPFYTD